MGGTDAEAAAPTGYGQFSHRFANAVGVIAAEPVVLAAAVDPLAVGINLSEDTFTTAQNWRRGMRASRSCSEPCTFVNHALKQS